MENTGPFGVVTPLSCLAQWLAWRLKIPSILLLLVFEFGLSSLTDVFTIADFRA